MRMRRKFALLICIAAAACSVRKLPIVGGPGNLQAESVRSIKTISVRRIAVMPVLEAPDQNDKTSIAAYLRAVGAKPALVDKRTGK